MKLAIGNLPNAAMFTGLLFAMSFAARPAVGQDSASGADLFKQKCATCHAADGSGNTAVGKSLKAADLRTPEIQKKPDAELTQSISEGKGNMPGFKGQISDDEIHSVLGYVRTLGAKGDSATKKK